MWDSPPAAAELPEPPGSSTGQGLRAHRAHSRHHSRPVTTGMLIADNLEKPHFHFLVPFFSCFSWKLFRVVAPRQGRCVVLMHQLCLSRWVQVPDTVQLDLCGVRAHFLKISLVTSLMPFPMKYFCVPAKC